ncbi:MAG: SMP-30/gluconolactonase/LRE family protein [Pyrinomonadaceae bacterium]
MSSTLKITSIDPPFAIPGGEIAVACENFRPRPGTADGVYIEGMQCRIVAASIKRILAVVPEEIAGGETTPLRLACANVTSEPFEYNIAEKLVDGMHIVANPAIDPADDAVILTRSGGRGQHLPATLFRLEADAYLDELPEPILNPTGIAFDKDGQMFVTNRAQGEVYSVGRDGTATVYATGLGIATGLAFDSDGLMYVGDRSGTVYRVRDFAEVETFAEMEPSVAAYHMAFGPDGRLYMTSPALASFDAVHAIDEKGRSSAFFRGLGRPQGLAFDNEGNLYIAACYQGRHGIVRITPDGARAEHFVAGNNVVGVCFSKKGEMIIATGDSVYSLACGISGTLLPVLK